jgi:hypothetical protein
MKPNPFFFQRSWDWIHPSHRDLIIDQLSDSREMASRYIETGGISALNLALSQQGGATGDRKFPLLRYSESWETLKIACIKQVQHPKISFPARIFTILEGACSSKPIRPELTDLIANVCIAARDYWNLNEIVLSASLIRRFAALADISGRYISSPALQRSWMVASTHMKEAAREAENDPSSLSGEELAEWITMVNVVRSTEPRLIPKRILKDQFDDCIELYIHAFSEGLQDEIEEEEVGEVFQNQADRLKKFSAIVDGLAKLFPDRADSLNQLSYKLSDEAETLNEEAYRRTHDPDEEPDSDYKPSGSFRQEMPLEKIFDDL